jgi:citrate lyase subunit beta / citryl-CoA lyase
VQARRSHAEEVACVTLRSLLFVPGDSERKQEKARGTAADALILDLEDSVAPARLPVARDMVRAFLSAPRSPAEPQLWVRINGPASGIMLEDLNAVAAANPHGLVVPKVSDAQEIHALDQHLSALEKRDARPLASTRLIVIATETARGVQSTASYTSLPRLSGITWGAEDLAAALGAATNREPDGSYGFTYRLARSLCLIAAAAMEVQAIDAAYVDFRDSKGLEREAAAARREGFLGKLAIHPDQIDAINAAFTPDATEVERARRIVAAFDASHGSGVLTLDGQMIDRPHLLQARRLLAAAEQAAARRKPSTPS